MRLWLTISGILVFAAGCAVGFLLFREVGSASGLGGGAIPSTYSDVSSYLVAGEDIYKALDLGEEQKRAFDTTLAAYYRRVAQIRGSLRELQLDLREKIDSLLSPDQREKYEEILQGYRERELQGQVAHELINLGMELSFTPEQEARAYSILYDAARDRREVWRSRVGPDVGRKKWEEIDARRDGRILEILNIEQAAKYTERRERERHWWAERERKERRDRKGKDEGRRDRAPREPDSDAPPPRGDAPPKAPPPRDVQLPTAPADAR